MSHGHLDSKSLPSPITEVTVALPEWIERVIGWDARYSTDSERMTLALTLAQTNVREKTGGPFGAAIFDRTSGQLLGVGVNRVAPSNNCTLHAEVVAIMMAQHRLQTYSLAKSPYECELFTSCEPCAMCLGATMWSGVRRLVCAATSRDAESIGFDEGPVFPESYSYIQERGIEVVRGWMREAGAQVLKDYLQGGGLLYNGTSV